MFNTAKVNPAIVKPVRALTRRAIYDVDDAINYIEDLIIETRDPKYVFEKKQENRHKPKELWTQFMEKMDVKPKMDRQEYAALVQEIGSLLGDMDMYHKGVTGTMSAFNANNIIDLYLRFKMSIEMLEQGGINNSIIYLSTMLLPKLSLALLNFEWFANLDSVTQSILVKLHHGRWECCQ